jgi:hypothetical protein
MAFNLRGPLLEPARRPGDRRGPIIVTDIPAQARPALAGPVERQVGIADGSRCRPGQRLLHSLRSIARRIHFHLQADS